MKLLEGSRLLLLDVALGLVELVSEHLAELGHLDLDQLKLFDPALRRLALGLLLPLLAFVLTRSGEEGRVELTQ